jgi:uncharacterized membrane protein YgdD (TMEM256/DUF423 family)
MIVKLAIVAGAFTGGIGVALGAFGAHGLRGTVEDRLLETFQTAVQYQMMHALALILMAVVIQQWGRSLAFDITVYAFIAGIVLFSGSLYGLVLTEMKWLGPVTPVGGLCFIAGWFSLAAGGINRIG